MRLMPIMLLAGLAMFGWQRDSLAAEVPVKLLSFNIRYGTANDGDDSWPQRHELVFDVIRTQQPDFCGLQEALRFQIDAIRKVLPEYSEFGVGRDDGKKAGEYSAILYREERWNLEEGETLWLSDTPTQVASSSWGNSIPRIVTWGRFTEKSSGADIFVFNTHFDHRSQPSRLKSANFLRALIAEKAGTAPVVLMGDFNAGEDNPAIEYLTAKDESTDGQLLDTFRVLYPDAEEVGTFNGFKGRANGAKIDFVFASPTLEVKSAEIVHHNDDGRYPSDHFPVAAEVLIPSP